MKQLFLLMILAGCSVEQREYQRAVKFCSDKDGVYNFEFDLHEPIVNCKNGVTSHLGMHYKE